MASLPTNSTITTVGDYDIPLRVGYRYLLLTKTATPTTADVQIKFPVGASDAFVAADGGLFLADTGKSEGRFIAVASPVRISVTAIGDPIKITLIGLSE